MLIYLADTVHHARGQLNPGTVPYNIARIAAYCQAKYPEHDYQLFKDPHVLLAALRAERPDILALSHYFWNTKLNHAIARYARGLHRGLVIVTGGPSLDRNETAYRAYAQEHPYVDYVVVDEGEVSFANVIAGTYEGCFGDGRLYPSQPRVRNLDDLPSPYLNGMLDPFLEMGLRPILETVRGCPYKCLAGDTPINTIFGDIPIRDLAERYGDGGVPVYTYDPETKSAFISDSVRIRKYGENQQLVRVHFDDETHIDCTPDHRFLQFAGGGRQWECEAHNLSAGSRVRAIRTEINPYFQRAYVTWARRDRQLRSRMVKEYQIGRHLTRTEQVHHVDHDTLNDAPDNLVLCASAADHSAYHPEIAERMRTNNPTKNGVSQEWRNRLSAAGGGKVRSHESRLRYRESKLGVKNPNFKDGATSGKKSRIAEVNHRVVFVEWLAVKGDVYCLTVPATGWFFANHVLVKNCAFCEQGSDIFTKIAALSVERVEAEVEYIRTRTKADQLILADVNFGILKRDLQVAKFLKASHKQHGWPRSLYVYNAKLPTETTLQTMEMLYPMAQLCMSFQSTSEEVLENIHRSNIGYDKYSFITKWAKARGLPVGTELIYGLPGETRESFIEGYETLLKFRADYMASYNLRLFPGIELNSPAKREQYEVKTRFRPMDVHLGEYQLGTRERIVEIEEIVLSNATLSEEDFFYVRRLAFLVEALWNTGYLRPALAYLANHGHRITDILRGILSQKLAFFDEYDRFVHDELSEDPTSFMNDWDSLIAGRALKVNLAFAGRLLLFENRMDEFFHDCLRQYPLPGHGARVLDEILLHCRASRINLDHPEPVKQRLFFDVPAWVQATYPKETDEFEREVEYEYALDPVCLPALRVRNGLKGASLNYIAERIIMEVPEVYRRTRVAKGVNVVTEDLQQRMAWAG